MTETNDRQEPRQGRPPIPVEDLLDEIRRLADGETPPGSDDMDAEGNYSRTVYTNRFGSWNEAVEKAGFEPRPRGPPPLPEDDLLFDLNVGHDLLGKWPSSYEYKAFGEHDVNTIIRHFGSWEAAIDAAKAYREEEWVGLSDDLEVIEDAH